MNLNELKEEIMYELSIKIETQDEQELEEVILEAINIDASGYIASDMNNVAINNKKYELIREAVNCNYKYYLNHFDSGNFEMDGEVVYFYNTDDADAKLKEWKEQGWSVMQGNTILYTFDPELDDPEFEM